MACVWSKNQLLTQSNASLSDSPLRSSSHVGLPLLGIKTAKSSSRSEFCGQSIVYPNKYSQRNQQAPPVKVGLSIGKAMKWWEKGIQPNMKEVCSAQDLVDSLLDAGNTLVIVDFFSPGCGGCRALHPKICQIAEQNPEVQFLQINYEEHKSMCYSLNVHVLPFFRFYRGAQGRLCSFSCTNATIKKFKDALAKHTTERCSLGSARGLEETELLALAENKDLLFNYTKKSDPFPVHACSTPTDNLSSNPRTIIQEAEEKSLVIF